MGEKCAKVLVGEKCMCVAEKCVFVGVCARIDEKCVSVCLSVCVNESECECLCV